MSTTLEKLDDLPKTVLGTVYLIWYCPYCGEETVEEPCVDYTRCSGCDKEVLVLTP